MAGVCFVCVCVCVCTCVMCVNVCVYFVCVIDVAEGHRSALLSLSLAWQVCILCVYVCVC